MSTRPRLALSALVSCSMALFGNTAAAAPGKGVAEATPAEKNEAGNLYAAAMADFERNDLNKALKGFRDSYGVVKSPNSHYMIASTLARLGQNDEAYDELQATIAEADAAGSRYSETQHQAYVKLEEIRPRVALVIVKFIGAPKGTTATVNDRHLDEAQIGKPIPVLPGDTVVTAITPDDRRYPSAQTVEAGKSTTVTIDVATEAERRKGLVERPNKPTGKIELEAAVAGETFNPPGDATRGAGPALRVGLQLTPRGILGATDNFAVVGGADWIVTSTDAHLWTPVVLQWNLWLTSEFSLRFEPGVALMFGSGTHVSPALYLGLRYRVYRQLYITGRAGVPDATLGASLFL